MPIREVRKRKLVKRCQRAKLSLCGVLSFLLLVSSNSSLSLYDTDEFEETKSKNEKNRHKLNFARFKKF